MAETYLASSPNWYLTRVSDCCRNGSKTYFVFGGRNSVYLLRTDCNPVNYECCIVDAHEERVGSIAASPHESNDLLCCTLGDDGCAKIWNLLEKKLLLQHIAHKVAALTFNTIRHTRWSIVLIPWPCTTILTTCLLRSSFQFSAVLHISTAHNS